MPPGRPRKPGSEEERKQNRREQVRLNVRAHRKRAKASQQRAGNDHVQENDQNTISNVDSGQNTPSSTRSAYGKRDIATTSHHVKILRELKGGSFNFSLEFLFRVEVGKLYREASVAAFHRFYGAAEGKTIRVGIGCSTWVTNVCFQAGSGRPGSDMLADALLAAALHVVGTTKLDDSKLKFGIAI